MTNKKTKKTPTHLDKLPLEVPVDHAFVIGFPGFEPRALALVLLWIGVECKNFALGEVASRTDPLFQPPSKRLFVVRQFVLVRLAAGRIEATAAANACGGAVRIP